MFCSDDCRSLYLVKKRLGPMIADQEQIHGCVRFAFQLPLFLKPSCQKLTFIFMLLCFIDIFCNNKTICNIFIVFKHWQPSSNNICQEICRIKIITIPLSRRRMFYIMFNFTFSTCNSLTYNIICSWVTYFLSWNSSISYSIYYIDKKKFRIEFNTKWA